MEKLERAKEEAFRLLQKWAGDEKCPYSRLIQEISGESGKAKMERLKGLYELGNMAFEEKNLADLTYKKLKEICRKNVDVEKDNYEFLHEKIQIERQEFIEVLESIDAVLAPLVLIHGVDGSIRQEQAEEFARLVKNGGVASTLESVFEMAEAAQYYMPVDVLKVKYGYADESHSLHRTEKGDGPLYTVELELKLGANGMIGIGGDGDYSSSFVRASVTE